MTYYEVYKKREGFSCFANYFSFLNQTTTLEEDVVIRKKDVNTFVKIVNNSHLCADDYGIRTVETDAELKEK